MDTADPIERLNAALEGRYRIERQLGEGGMATVYLARDEKYERQVAIKVLHPDLVGAGGSERFLREVRVIARLHHPNILALLDSGEADGLLYYVMPYVDGETLRHRLDVEGAIPLEDALHITAEVADALEAAHQAGVLHRDIKPANILLEAGHAIVADFGIAKGLVQNLDDGLTRTGVSVGTPAYMSPEQGAGDAKVDARSDIYALGCVLYEMLVGEPPFTGSSAVSVLARHAMDPVPDVHTLRKSVPEGVKQVLLRALEKVPADRYASAADLRDAVRSPPEVVGASPAVRSRATLRWVAAVLAGVAGAVGALYVVNDRPTSGVGEPQTVLVWPFASRIGDARLDRLGEAMTDRVAEAAQLAGLANVVSGAVPGTSTEGGYDPVLIRAQAAAAGADLLVVGSLSIEGDSLRVSARITGPDPEDIRRPLPAVSAHVSAEQGVHRDVVSRVLGALALEVDPDIELWGDEANGGRPPLWEALEAWQNALDLASRGQTEEHYDELRRALEIDPHFASPALRLVLTGEETSWAGELNRNRDNVGPRGLLRLDFARAWGLGQWDAMHVLLDRMAETAPQNSWEWLFIGIARTQTGHYRSALDAFDNLDAETVTSRGDLVYWSFKGDALHALGDFEAQRRLGIQASALAAGAGVQQELDAVAAMGDREAVDSILDAQARARSGDIADLRRLAAQELDAHGYPDEAQQLFDQAVQEFEESGEASDPRFAYVYAVTLGYAGRWQEAHGLFEALYERAGSGPLGVVGCMGCDAQALVFHRAQAAAHLGDEAIALELSDELGDAYLKARIRAVLGQREMAVALLRQSFAEGKPIDAYDHVNPDFASLRGFESFDQFMRPVE